LTKLADSKAVLCGSGAQGQAWAAACATWQAPDGGLSALVSILNGLTDNKKCSLVSCRGSSRWWGSSEEHQRREGSDLLTFPKESTATICWGASSPRPPQVFLLFLRLISCRFSFLLPLGL